MLKIMQESTFTMEQQIIHKPLSFKLTYRKSFLSCYQKIQSKTITCHPKLNAHITFTGEAESGALLFRFCFICTVSVNKKETSLKLRGN